MDNQGNAPAVRDRDPIEVGQVLADSFALMRDRPLIIFAVSAITILPTRLLAVGLPALVENLEITSTRTGFWIGAITAGLIGGVMRGFGHGALVGAVLAHRRGAKPGFLDTLVPALKRFPAIVAVALLAVLGETAGLLFLVVPGILATLMWSVAGAALIAERTSIVDAFRRSQTLTDNLLWRIFLLLLVVGLGVGALLLVTQFSGRLMFGTGSNDLDYPFVLGPFLLATLSQLLGTAFGQCVNCTLYAVLVESRGDGPMRDHLNSVFE